MVSVGTFETNNLVFLEANGSVAIKGESGRIHLGPQDDSGREECPTVLLGEWDALVDLVRDSERFGVACEAEAMVRDLDPWRW